MGKKSFLDYDSSICIKGIAAIMICISHAINIDYPSYLQFLRYGGIWVGIFFFYSGYGLLISYKNKENYLKNFKLQKIKKLYIPMVLAELVYMVSNKYLFDIKYNFWDSCLLLIGVKLANPILWYVQCIIIIYILFYVIYSNEKIKNKIIILDVMYLIFMMAAIILNKFIGIDTWWYISTSALIIGFNYAEYKKEIEKIHEKKITLYFACINIVILVLSVVVLNFSTVYGKNPLLKNNNYFIILLEMVIVPIFTVTIVYFSFIFSKKNKVFTEFGKISMEIYFYHKLIINIVDEMNIVTNLYVRLIIIIIGSCLLAFIMNKINNLIYNYLNKKLVYKI